MTNPNDSTVPVIDMTKQQDDGTKEYYTVGGLTKREYFAGLALQGIAMLQGVTSERTVKIAVELADALIAELNKEQK